MTATSPISYKLWHILRSQEEPSSVADLAHILGTDTPSVGVRLSRWTQCGFLLATKPYNPRDPNLYVMAETARRHPAPPNARATDHTAIRTSGPARMWRAIRVKKRFDLVELQVMAEVTASAARAYVSTLLRAGILRREVRGSARTGLRSVYALTGTFGPLPPMIRRRPGVGRASIITFTDPNTGATCEISACGPVAPLF